MYQRALVVIKC